MPTLAVVDRFVDFEPDVAASVDVFEFSEVAVVLVVDALDCVADVKEDVDSTSSDGVIEIVAAAVVVPRVLLI